MRKLLLLLLVAAGFSAAAQKAEPLKDNPNAPYLKQKTLPAFDVLYLNGKDTFHTKDIPVGKPSVIVYFSPDCDHCKKVISAMLAQMDKMKDVNVYFMTFMPVIALEIFNRGYHLERYPSVKLIGQDFKMFFPEFYGVSSVPNVVLYNKNKKFVKLWKNDVTMEEIVAELKRAK
ncbi:MAG: thioredoxin family protein [Flavipsychrobacter sp.]|nr:thioredoxin family protein [Flavipsychrobacter sp.]